ncbi:hypothetical protein [Methanogenium cariaci]|nr:hypothetical protein [Methanogenium cariaci]
MAYLSIKIDTSLVDVNVHPAKRGNSSEPGERNIPWDIQRRQRYASDN